MQQTEHFVGYLWRASFVINKALGLERRAQEVFQQKVARHLWAINQTGRIDLRKINHFAILLVIDVSEREAQKAFNQLPTLLVPNFNTKWERDWKLPLYDHNDPGWKDYLIYRNGIFYLEGLERAWDGFQNSRFDLDEGITGELRKLK